MTLDPGQEKPFHWTNSGDIYAYGYGYVLALAEGYLRAEFSFEDFRRYIERTAQAVDEHLNALSAGRAYGGRRDAIG